MILLQGRPLYLIVQFLAITIILIMPKNGKSNKVYAVAVGRTTGMFATWQDCHAQVHGHARAKFQSFRTPAEADAYLHRHGIGVTATIATTKTATTATAGIKSSIISGGSVKVAAPSFFDSSITNNSRCAGTKRSAAAAAAADATVIHKRPRRQSIDKNSVDTAVAEVDFAADSHSNDDAASTKIAICFDGGARGNPGIAGAGATVTLSRSSSRSRSKFPSSSSSSMHAAAADADSGTARTVWHIRAYVGDACTNNQAEYQGLVTALRLAKREWNNYQAAAAGAAAVTSTTNPQQKRQQQQQQQHRNNVLIVQGDSKLIIEQLKGVYQCRSDKLKSSYREAKALLDEFSTHCQVSLEHVYRAQNKAADALANEAMDARRSWITTSADNHEKQYPLENDTREQVVHI